MVQVGKGRAYTPTQDDVGYTLKYEISVVDRVHQYTDLGRTQVVYTSRVRPTPNPPCRQMVQMLPPTSQTYPGSRFTVLSYNLLADLYAKVGGEHCTTAGLYAALNFR